MAIATIYTMTGCEHCATLEGLISSAGLTSQVTVVVDQGVKCGSGTPCTVISATGTCYGFPSCDETCQMAAIQAAASPTATKTSTTTPAATPKAAGTTTVVTPTPAWRTSNWGNELSIDWGAKNPKPTIAQTPAGYEPPDVSLTPVLPLPPVMSDGITVSLRDHKRLPIGRKVA
jgi:hypothetical protein